MSIISDLFVFLDYPGLLISLHFQRIAITIFFHSFLSSFPPSFLPPFFLSFLSFLVIVKN